MELKKGRAARDRVTADPRHLSAHAARIKERFVRPPRPWEEIAFVVGSAAIVSILLDALLVPPTEPLELLARFLGSFTRLGFAILFGLWLGKRAWPRRGRRIGRWFLKRALRGKARPVILLTERPDVVPRTPRRILEVVGFSVGMTILVATALTLGGLRNVGFAVPAGLFILLSLWGAFVLVPYWTFARLGLRRVDAVRLTVEPLSRHYASRLRLSNGALLLVALSLTVNLGFRSGLPGQEVLLNSLRFVGHLVAAILVIAAAAVAYYARAERAVVLELQKDALQLGVKDARPLTDGDFLPRGL